MVCHLRLAVQCSIHVTNFAMINEYSAHFGLYEYPVEYMHSFWKVTCYNGHILRQAKPKRSQFWRATTCNGWENKTRYVVLGRFLRKYTLLLRHHGIVPSLRWRHNGRDSVSNHQPHGCLLNRLFRRRSKKTSKLRVTGLCAGISPVPGEFPHKWPVTRNMFPFDDLIMFACQMIALQHIVACSRIYASETWTIVGSCVKYVVQH